jgi:hypothetical protein
MTRLLVLFVTAFVDMVGLLVGTSDRPLAGPAPSASPDQSAPARCAHQPPME